MQKAFLRYPPIFIIYLKICRFTTFLDFNQFYARFISPLQAFSCHIFIIYRLVLFRTTHHNVKYRKQDIFFYVHIVNVDLQTPLFKAIKECDRSGFVIIAHECLCLRYKNVQYTLLP
ncbi:unnamed protein product [Rotaria socialis]